MIDVNINKLRFEINSLQKSIQKYQNQLEFAESSSESNEEEIISIQDRIKVLKKDMDILIQEYRFLTDNTVVHNINDIQKMYYGLFGNSIESKTEWSAFYNEFKNDDEMFNHITKNYTQLSRQYIRQYLKRRF